MRWKANKVAPVTVKYPISHNNSTFRGDMPPLNYNDKNMYTGLSDDTLHCIEWEWHKSLPVNGKTYEITNLSKNVKNTQNSDEHLMYKLFLIIESWNINIWTHLLLLGHRNSLWTTQNGSKPHGTAVKLIKINGKDNQNANTIPDNAVEAT